MSRRGFDYEGFSMGQGPRYREQAPVRSGRQMYLPSQGGSDDDEDVGNIGYASQEEGDEEQPVKASTGEPDEVDPLDAFMAGIDEEVVKAGDEKPVAKPDIEEEEDPMESFLAARKDAGLSLAQEALHAGYDSDEEVYATARAVDAGAVEYDSDDNPVVTLDKKKLEPLEPLDHACIDYDDFAKDLYEEDLEITAMSEPEVAAFRAQKGIRVSGFDVPRPIMTFQHAGFDETLAGVIAKQGYETPTPIQCQALPVVMSGRDMIGIAKTGSGKTAAFVLPMMGHILDQPELGKGEGPIAVVCAPTRELAQQILAEAKKFAKPYGIRVAGVLGGMSKFEQFKELKTGTEVVVATPGRLIDMLKMKALTLARTTYLVLDEADRMFDLGFEPQVRSIVGQIRPDRQTLLFSATMPGRIERLARDILSSPIRVTVGDVGSANEDIRQVAEVVAGDDAKLAWLLGRLPRFIDEGDVLVFANQKAKVEAVEAKLKEHGFRVAALHGDKDQASRMEVLREFKAGVHHVLVATDVAARGLDITSIKTVVNLDAAKDIDTHVHRIGRTGRAGATDGTAYTLVTGREAHFAGELVHNLVHAGQAVPDALLELAMKDAHFRKQRAGGGAGPDFNRAAAQNSLKQGMLAKFKSSFVAPQAAAGDATSFKAQAAHPRPTLQGFAKPAQTAGPAGSSLAGFARAATSIQPDAPLERHNTDAEIAEALAHARAVAHAQAYGAPYAAAAALPGPGAQVAVAAAAAQARALAYAHGVAQVGGAPSMAGSSDTSHAAVANGGERGANERQRGTERRSRWDRHEDDGGGERERQRGDSGAERRERSWEQPSSRHERVGERDRDWYDDGRSSDRNRDYSRDDRHRQDTGRESYRERDTDGDRKRDRDDEGRHGREGGSGRRRRWDM